MMAMRYGVARGIFSNEAGLGTAGIAQAAGKSSNAVESGLVGMMGTFIDTLIVCTMTGLVLIVTGEWSSGVKGAALTSNAFAAAFPGFGGQFLSIAVAVFAFTTILGWAYYGEKCWEYLVGTSVEKPYRLLWTAFVMVGAVTQLDFVWLVSDTLNAFMAFPNPGLLVAALAGDREAEPRIFRQLAQRAATAGFAIVLTHRRHLRRANGTAAAIPLGRHGTAPQRAPPRESQVERCSPARCRFRQSRYGRRARPWRAGGRCEGPGRYHRDDGEW